MLEKYLTTLEFTKVLENLGSFAAFSASRQLVDDLKPSPYFTEVNTWQAETSEARSLLSVKADLSVGGASDIRPLIARANRAMTLVPQDFLAIRKTLIVARELNRTITRLEDQFPLLAGIAYCLEENTGLVNRISQCIDDAGEVKDSASPELARIRRQIEIVHNRLLERMRRYLTSEQYRQYLQENIITQRDGRYVVPLKADFKGRIRGVVHGQSGSGATLFVEPMPVVELNNEWRQLQSEEDEEIHRILLALTLEVSEQGQFIAATVQALAELDFAFAKARYAEHIRATAPALIDWPDDAMQSPKHRLILQSARHPLLDPEEVIPIDLVMGEKESMLVITGPNTGGKTVSLKTVGLLALMTQSGLHLPTDKEASMLVFDGIYADIGDEQSLEQSLSTFSSHMTNIVTILEHSTDQSLVIFDELGAGTDPLEGEALARSILNHLLKRRVTTLVATHFAELKGFAYLTQGVVNASMEFNLETLSPTYRLLMGVPGSSNAFIIAARLGLSETIVEAAKNAMNQEAKETESILGQIKQELKDARLERLRLGEERAEAEYDRKKAGQALARIEVDRQKILAEVRQQMQTEIDDLRREMRHIKEKANKVVATAATRGSRKGANPVGSTASQMKELEDNLDNLAHQVKPKMAKAILGGGEEPWLQVGKKIEVPRFSSKGVITGIKEQEVEVQLGSFRTMVKRSEIAPLDNNEEEVEPIKQSRGDEMPISPGIELDLRGNISEDALLKMNIHLDQAYLAGLPYVHIIHGKGSGTLRRVVRAALHKHPLISSFKGGGQGEGGEGVTVARLALDR